jgi:DNA polymerase V
MTKRSCSLVNLGAQPQTTDACEASPTLCSSGVNVLYVFFTHPSKNRSLMPSPVLINAVIEVPMVAHGVCAGFPSPADDHLDDPIDLTSLLIQNPPATFLWRVDGSSMRDAGIFDGDLLVVDRSLDPRDGDVVVATVDGERTLKRLSVRDGRPHLSLENSDMPAYELSEVTEVEVWGVIVCNIHFHRQGGR